MTDTSGDIWDVPPITHDEFPGIALDIYRDAEPLLTRWAGKCRDACDLHRVSYRPGWLGPRTGRTANELGAPVGQALRVAQLRRLTDSAPRPTPEAPHD